MAECCVCFRKYDRAECKPRSLPCGHALCGQCVHAAATVRANGAADHNHYQPLGCPFCRHSVPDWLALPLNYPVLDMLEQLSAPTGGGPQIPQIASSEMHNDLSTAQQIQGGSSYKMLQGSDLVLLITNHVKQLYSRELQQQLQAVTALAEQTALAAQEGPFAALATAFAPATAAADSDTWPSSSSELERQQAVCRLVADAGGFAGLVSLLLQTPQQGSMSADAGDRAMAAEVQHLGTRVLCSLLFCLPDRFHSAVDAGVVRVLQQLLGSPSVDTQSLAVNMLLALAGSSEPAVQAAVLQPELLAPAAALLKSDSTVVQVSSIELLQLLLREHPHGSCAAPAAAALAASTASAGGSTDVQMIVLALTRLLGNSNVEVQQAAYVALWAFISKAGPSAVVQQVALLLGQPCPKTQLTGCDLLTVLLMHLSKTIPVQELSSAGVVEAAMRLLGSEQPAVQAAAAQAAAVLSLNPEGVAVLVSIPQAVQQLVDLLGKESTQESAATALRRIAEYSVMPWQLEAVRERCGAEIRAAEAIPAALDLMRSSVDPGDTHRPSGATVRSLLLMLQCCNMRPDAAAVIQQAGGLDVMQQVVRRHSEAELPGGMPMQPLGGAPFSQKQGPTGQSAWARQGGGIQLETSLMEPSYAIWADHIITCGELELVEPIEDGAEGKVYRGKWCGLDIAAQEYMAVDGNEQTEWTHQLRQNALLQEVGVLSKLNHPNLVRFCGVCLDPPLVVMESSQGGSIFKMLECARAAVQHGQTNENADYLSWSRRLQMLHDMASGMMYLHSRQHVHGDLRSHNLFVADNNRVMVGAFGFTNRLKRSKELLRRLEPINADMITDPRWVAPELLGESNMSTASDVYSFGIIMYEMLTFKIPFEDCANEMVAIEVLAHAMRPQIPSFDQLPPNTSRICLASYIRLMQDCWQQDPKQRPTMATVARRLKAMQHWFFACSNALHISNTTEVLPLAASAAPIQSWTAGLMKLEARVAGRPPTPSSTTLPDAASAAVGASAVAAAGEKLPRVHGNSSGIYATDLPCVSQLPRSDADAMQLWGGELAEQAAVDVSKSIGSGTASGKQQQPLYEQPPPQRQQQYQQPPPPPQQQYQQLSSWGHPRMAYGSSTYSSGISEPPRYPYSSSSGWSITSQQYPMGLDSRREPTILEDMPQQAAYSLMSPVAAVPGMLPAPQWQQPGGRSGLQVQPLGSALKSHDKLQGPLDKQGREGGEAVETSLPGPSDAIRAEHIITRGELELGEPIGVGVEVTVYHGKWCGTDIAAREYHTEEGKRARPCDSAGEWTGNNHRKENALLREVGILTALTHPNLVRFCGVCLDPPMVVMEYYRNGSMFKMLECARAAVQQHRTNKYVDYLSWKRRLRMLHDVACGMTYMHSRCYVHGDLRSPNLFVTENGRAKIGDFGHTERLQDSNETINVGRITHPRWAAPELLGESNMSTASDVYSFGIIMYEMLTFKIPFEADAKAMVAIKVLAHAMRPQIPSFDQLPLNTSRICLANYIRLMQDCWQQDPKQRPSFATVARRLKAMQHWFSACSNSLPVSNSSNPAVVPLALSSFNEPNRREPAVLAAAGHAMQPATSSAAHEAMGVGWMKGVAGCVHQPQQPQQQQQEDPHSQQDDKLSGDCGAVFDSAAMNFKRDAALYTPTADDNDDVDLKAHQKGHEASDHAGSSNAACLSGSPAPTPIVIHEGPLPASTSAASLAGSTGMAVIDPAADLAAGAAALDLLQPTLHSPLQQLLVVWAVFLAHEAAVRLARYAGDTAACLSNRTPASQQLSSPSCSSSTVQAAATAAADRLSSLQHCLEGQQSSVWVLLWSQLQLVRSCWRLQQQLQQGRASRRASFCRRQQLLLAAAMLSVLAWLVYGACTGAGRQLQVQQLLTAVVLVLAVHFWGPRWLSNRRAQQQPGPQALEGQAEPQGSAQQQGFAVFSCLADVPGDLWLDKSPDAAASTLSYSAFACSDAAGAAAAGIADTEQAASMQQQQQPQQQPPGLLLCVLPQPFCEQLQQGHLGAAGHTSSDTALARDQGSHQQHPPGQHSSMAAAAATAAELISGRVQLQQHPMLHWCGFEEDLRPEPALRHLLPPLQAALCRDQRRAQHFETSPWLVPVRWVCLDPPMMLQDTPAGSTLASWLLEQQQEQQLQQQVQAEWTPPFPKANWLEVLTWLQDVTAALQLLHQQGVVHGGVHAGSVHLLSSQGGGLRAQLSLAEPWFTRVTVVAALDPALSAPEMIGLAPVNKSSSSSRNHPAASADDYGPCTDVYGLGMLMWQLATGWVPQQAESPTEAQAEVSWCADMRDRYGATFPGAADAVAAGDSDWADAWGSSSGSSTHTKQRGSGAAAGSQDVRHGWLPSAADSWLPGGYRALMHSCCQPVVHSRPSLQDVQHAYHSDGIIDV